MFRNRAFSLLELLAAMAVLTLLLSLVFGSFVMATRCFYETSTRQSAETELRAIKVLLQRDIEGTSFWQVGSATRVTPQGERDGLSLVTLDDWSNNLNYNVTSQRPDWNRYVVWYATQEQPGRLIRQVIQPPSIPINDPYLNLGTNMNDIDPLANAGVLSSRTLSRNVLDFEVEPRLQNGSVRVRARLYRQGLKRALSNTQVEDTLEVTMIFRPRNTWPVI
ncbi:MAG: type II secretion system protein [Candidatus Eremiobacteraeota bacterium]|nr:type II secretion system protein [Candidatus Eremiobacteraeota bacterium]